MTSKEESIYNMFRAVNQVGIDHAGIVATVPALAAGFSELDTRITAISGLISLQAAVLSGITIDKGQLKEKMAKLAYNYSGPGRAWAAANDDDINYNKLNLSQSKIIRFPDDVAGPNCQNMYDILNANSAALVSFGLTAPMLTELLNAINDYTAIVPLPTSAINQRQTYTQNIESAIKNSSLFLERQLDNIVRGQVNANPDFVSNYFFSREIIDPPRQSTTFRIKVLNNTNDNPVFNARAEIMGTSKIAFTDLSGLCEIKEFPKGTYTLHVSHETFNPSQQIVAIGLGETKDLIFRLTPL